MDTKLKENLSAYMDGELNEQDARMFYEHLQQDDELKTAWSRYHYISDVLKREATAVASDDLADRVHASLQDEPTILAPRRHFRKLQQVGRHAASFAVAASITAMAILGIQNFALDPADAPVQVAEQPIQRDWVRVSGTRWDMDQPEVENRLNAYLVKHNEFVSGNSGGGMLPYATIVGYDVIGEDSQQ